MVVPRLAERTDIALDTHRGMGHFGVERVLNQLHKNYLLRSMDDMVVEVVKAYPPSARV